MRSRERLIEVLRSVNSPVAGDAGVLRQAADFMDGSARRNALYWLRELSTHHACSQHIRELASEALAYLEEPADG